MYARGNLTKNDIVRLLLERGTEAVLGQIPFTLDVLGHFNFRQEMLL